MARFRIELELTGLKLKVEGDRSEIPLITHNVGQQLAGLLQPTAELADDGQSKSVDDRIIEARPVKSSRKRVRRSDGSGATDTKPQPINWSHDYARWGSPRQSWSAGKKALWLLYVLGQAGQSNGLTAQQLAVTFNRAFKEAKTIPTGNVTRDFGRFKSSGFVGEDTSVAPSTWHLLDDGKEEAQKLLQEAQKKKSSSDQV